MLRSLYIIEITVTFSILSSKDAIQKYSQRKMEVHVVSKQDNSQHRVIPFSSLGVSALNQITNPASRVRVRPIVISLSSNNLSYARGGVVLRCYVDQKSVLP
jgi:hypothetical protein